MVWQSKTHEAEAVLQSGLHQCLDGRNRIALQPVVDVDERLAFWPGFHSLRPRPGLKYALLSTWPSPGSSSTAKKRLSNDCQNAGYENKADQTAKPDEQRLLPRLSLVPILPGIFDILYLPFPEAGIPAHKESNRRTLKEHIRD